MLNHLDLRVPTLLLDKERCIRNIDRMLAKARASNVAFRPHFKTHQSRAVGHWFRERGVDRIAVSSLRMARYFAEDGWDDITVAFPINVRELDTIQDLAGRLSLNILVESPQTVRWLDKHLRNRVGVFIKVDVGTRRTGIDITDPERVEECLRVIKHADKLGIRGFLSHAGHTYDAQSIDLVQAIYRDSTSALQRLKMQFEKDYGPLIVSYGDTPSCSIIEAFDNIEEVRPGNFIFYDLMQSSIGSCRRDDIAVAMAVPVVALHPERGQFVVYGGSIHFGKDALQFDAGHKSYGALVAIKGGTWSGTREDCYLSSLSQEHGIVTAPVEFIQALSVGDILLFVPVHSCQTAQLMGGYLQLDGTAIDHFAGSL